MVWWYNCEELHAACWVTGVNVGASTWSCYWLALAYQRTRKSWRRLSQESWEVDRTGTTLDWSLGVKGWSYMMGNALQSVRESGLMRGCRSDNTVRVT